MSQNGGNFPSNLSQIEGYILFQHDLLFVFQDFNHGSLGFPVPRKIADQVLNSHFTSHNDDLVTNVNSACDKSLVVNNRALMVGCLCFKSPKVVA